MISRRRFALIFGASLATRNLLSCQPSNTSQGPTVLTTWNNLLANKKALEVLSAGKSGLDALEAGIRHVEADPEDRSVGYGGRPDREGEVTLDACIMDPDGNAGSVTYLKEIMHPISVARLVMEKTPHVILSGQGAQQFALAQGFKKENLLTEVSKEEHQEWLKEAKYKPIPNIENHDTIGMLVKDKFSNLSGGCSTSGMAYKIAGRVGDSPIIGAGLYVDNEYGAVTATGVGELMLKSCAAFLATENMRSGMLPDEACKAAIKRIASKYDVTDAQVALIAMNKDGLTGAYSSLPGFVYAKTDMAKSVVLEAPSYYN